MKKIIPVTAVNKLLVVEDDSRLNRAVCKFLRDSGYEVVSSTTAEDALYKMYENEFAMVISDIMMPGMDGFELARSIRERNEKIPILFMTAKDDMPSKSKGYMIGIDDYMVKPVDLEELDLRIKALLRRAGVLNEKVLRIGNFVMNTEEMTVTDHGEEIPVTVREFKILYRLLSYPKKAFSRSQLLEEFWDADSDTTLRAVDLYVMKIRNKVAGCKDFKIVTVYGVGYKAVIE